MWNFLCSYLMTPSQEWGAGGRAHVAVCWGARPHSCPGAQGPSPDPPAFPSSLEGQLCVSASEDGTGVECPRFSPFAPRFPGKMPSWSPCSSPDARAQTHGGGGRSCTLWFSVKIHKPCPGVDLPSRKGVRQAPFPSRKPHPAPIYSSEKASQSPPLLC